MAQTLALDINRLTLSQITVRTDFADEVPPTMVDGPAARAALDRLHERRYDLVVFDMRMPDVAGEELHRNARAHDAENARGIIFTGDTATPRAWAFFADSSVPVVEKPFRPRALEDAAYRVVMAAGASTPSGASA